MEFSAFLVFAIWTSTITYLTFGEERERAMLFPDYYFFAERRLISHTIMKKGVKNLDDCELLCYLNDNCVSLNFKKDPDNGTASHICELNNATHLEYDSELTNDTNFYYRGSKNACDKNPPCQNNATCQTGFTLKGYRCLCPPGFKGEHCENDIDECKGNRSCHVNANCVNTIGSHVCKCHPGYTGSGRNCAVDPCYSYQNLSEAKRRSSYTGPVTNLCDDHFPVNNEPEEWYRYVGAAGTKMPTTRVKSHHCGTTWSGWLKSAHPIAEKSEVSGTVCFSDRQTGCESTRTIAVKNCGSYYIYKLFKPSGCPSRYCGTD